MTTQTPDPRSQKRQSLQPHIWLFLSATLMLSACATSAAADKSTAPAATDTSAAQEKECCQKKKGKQLRKGADAEGKSFRCENCPAGEGECPKCGTEECPKCAQGKCSKCSKCPKCPKCEGVEGAEGKCSKCAKSEHRKGQHPKGKHAKGKKAKCADCAGAKASDSADMPCPNCVKAKGGEGAEGDCPKCTSGECPKCASGECPHGERCGKHKHKRAKAEASVPEGATVVSVDEAQALHQAGKATFVDVNGKGVRNKFGVVPGAILLSSSTNYDPAAELPEDKSTPLVFYCANTRCTAAPSAAEKAVAAGYTQVQVLSAGIAGWKEADLKTDSVSP